MAISWVAAPSAEQANRDAARARQLAEGALDATSALYHRHGSENLLAAAQVYATLATRA